MSTNNIDFVSFDGVALQGTYQASKGPERAALLMVPGIDSNRNEYGFFSRLAEACASHGVDSFRFDWRCYGVDESRPTQQLTLSGVSNDIDAAAAVLRQHSHAERFFVVSNSFGGGVSADWVRRRSQEAVAGLALFAPVLDYVNDYVVHEGLGDSAGLSSASAFSLERDGHLATSGRLFGRAIYSEMPHFGARPSPNVPMLLVHGDADTAVPYELSVKYAAEVAGVDFVSMPGLEHGFATPGDEELEWDSTLANHQKVYSLLLDWIDRVS